MLAGLAGLASLPALAPGHGAYDANARPPVFNEATIRLVGAGRYVAENPHRGVRVIVCLQKLYNDRFFTVKCNARRDGDRGVRAHVAVPGCVEGVWRTTAFGQVLGRGGRWTHGALAESATKQC